MHQKGLISKHPMLKLIDVAVDFMLLNTLHFKTSHVKVNQVLENLDEHTELYFKTSHVKVNPICTPKQLQLSLNFKTSHVKVNPTYFLHSIQYTIPDSPVFINILKFFTSRRALCQKNSQNHCNTTVFADSLNFALIGGW